MICTNIDEMKWMLFTLPQTTNLGVTSGGFDIQHMLHGIYLNKCRADCDRLVVLIDSDKLFKANKKKDATFCETTRAFMINQQKPVDYVCVMNSLRDLHAVLQAGVSRNPTTLFRNSDTIYGEPCIQVKNVTIEIIPDVYPLNSTTEIINFIKQSKQG